MSSVVSAVSVRFRAALTRAGVRFAGPPSPTPPGETVLSARGVTVQFGGHTVLDQVDMDVAAGELVALVGPNGAGKSTLLTALSGDAPRSQEGTVTLHGRPIHEYTPAELALRRCVLQQDHAVSFPFQVREIVAMGRAPWAGIGHPEDDEAVVTQAMEATDITHLAQRRFPTLSGGEKARVALARVIAQKTPVMLWDEPTAALDIRHQEMVLRMARKRTRSGDAVVVVLHDLELAAAYADRVAIVSDARIAAFGVPEKVFTAPLLGRVYQQDVEVVSHPRSGIPLVLPVREGVAPPRIT